MTFWRWLLQGKQYQVGWQLAQHEESRLPLLRFFCLVAVLVTLVMVGRLAMYRLWALVGLYSLLSLSFGVTLVGLQRKRPLYQSRGIRHLVIAQLLITLALHAMWGGQSKALVLWSLLLIPLYGAFFLGPQACLLWGTLAVGAGLFVIFSEAWMPIHSLIPSVEVADATPVAFAFLMLIVIAGCLSFLFVIESHMSLLLQQKNESVQREHEALELSHELKRNRDRALAAVEAKSAFLANMSHEIRTPLNGVIGAASLLVESSLEPSQRSLVGTIHKSSELLLGIINDILDFSKLEAGHVLMKPEPFDVRDCVEDVLDLFAQAAWEKHIDLAYRMDHNVHPWVLVDAFRFQQVLINLVGNAVKFTSEGEVVVEVLQGDSPEQLCVRVRDTGVGIPPARLKELFQPFHQVDPSTTRRFGGTGLGLVISKHLIGLLGGAIQVESEPEVGSVFSFTIHAPPQPLEEGEDEDAAVLEGKRLLLVENQNTTRLCLTANANSWKMRVMATEHWEEAVAWLEQYKFDAILLSTSLHSPEQRALRVLALQPHVPVICFTSLADAYSRSSRERSMFSAVLLKPLRRRQMLNVLLSLFCGQAEEAHHRRTPQRQNWGEVMPLRILVAEDNPINQQVVLQILERLGYAPKMVSHGLEALEELEHNKYDMLFLDMQMPHMDGPTTAREIRRLWEHNERPYIVALTANVMQEQRRLFEEAGIDDFLGKPIRVEDLMRVLELFASRRRRERASQGSPSPLPSLRASTSDLRTPARLAVVRASMSSSATVSILSPESLVQMEQLCSQGTMVFSELVEGHIQNNKVLLEEMRQAIAEGRWEDLERSAHSLKSTSAMFGGFMVRSLCEQLEKEASLQEKHSVDATFLQLEAASGLFHRALLSYLSQSQKRAEETFELGEEPGGAP